MCDVVEFLDAIGQPQWERKNVTWQGLSRNFKADDFYIAYINDIPVGCMALVDYDPAFWADIKKGASLFIHKLAVKRCGAKQGVSKALIDFAKERAIKLGINEVRLDTHQFRKKVRAVYEREGFICLEEKCLFGKYHTAFYLWKAENILKMITYKKVDKTCFPQYDLIPMRVNVTSYYKIEKINRGLGGFNFVETPVEPYIKDFCTGDDESVTRWEKRRDLTNWAFFMAFDGERPVGAAAVASRDKTADMLSGRDDLAVLWDIRVDDAYKQRGIGKTLFDMAVDWSREQGLVQMKIECQNNNVPAVKFYHKQGAVLSAVDEYAYYDEPEYKHETQLIWMLDL